jgi:hypothetical protein
MHARICVPRALYVRSAKRLLCLTATLLPLSAA